eukprot:9179728-Pyramimonas_sp.AAC.2
MVASWQPAGRAQCLRCAMATAPNDSWATPSIHRDLQPARGGHNSQTLVLELVQRDALIALGPAHGP